MFRDPRDPINDIPIIDDGLEDDIGGGGGGIKEQEAAKAPI